MAPVTITMPDEYRQWQKEALVGMFNKLRAIIVAHRRAGKTEVVVSRLIMAALKIQRAHPKPSYAYIAPYLNQARSVAWDRLKYYSSKIPGTQIYETDLTVSLCNGSSIRIFGADYPDRLRGMGFDGAVMDEVAQMKPDMWFAVMRPALSDRNGWACFIGTPKGQNLFYDLYLEAVDSEDWYSGVFPADQTGVLSPEELRDLNSEMGDSLFRQEFLCDFTADNSDTFIDAGRVYDAERRQWGSLVNSAPVVMGVDVAAQGDDRSCVVVRRGAVLEKIEVWREPDTMKTVGRVADMIDIYHPKAVFIDSVGLGIGPVDRLKQLGYRVTGVNVGEKAMRDEKFSNLKAECWYKMNDWLEGAIIPSDKHLRKDLLVPKRDYDLKNRLKVESKKDLKARVGFSTDIADALALTFARPVHTSDARRGRTQQFYANDFHDSE